MKNIQQAVHTSASLAQLGSALGSEVVDVVEGMHGTIARAPFIFGRKTHPTTGITRFVYQCVRLGFTGSEKAWQLLSRQAAPAETAKEAQLVPLLGIINGVFGDTLVKSDNALATPLQMLHTAQKTHDTVIVFIHGLCMTELGWQHPAQQRFCTQQPADIAYVRYNSGRHIHENGKALDQELEKLASQYDNIILIGHSMGGLLINSALHQAQPTVSWPNHVSHIATLGTPYSGAALERAGEMANGLLNITPYTMPLWRLGNLRSQGIKDLRYANITDDDTLAQRPIQQWATEARKRALLIAATRSEEIGPNQKGKDDLLVTINSALAQDGQSGKIDQGNDALERQLFTNMNHMQLLHDEVVYDRLAQFIATIKQAKSA